MPKFHPKELHFSLELIALILKPLVRFMFRVTPRGVENLPKSGPYILVSNHVTNVDPLAVAYFVYVQLRRAPHFLAKEGLFKIPVISRLLLAAGQIPVFRSGARRNDEPLKVAYKYLDAGHTIAIFPEGTLTRDPNLWPMRGKFGAVRMALDCKVPIYAMAHWGAQDVLPRYGSKFRPGFWKKVDVLVGPEIDLAKYRKSQLTPAELQEATEVVMTSITELVEQLRGEKAPKERWNPEQKGQASTGNFTKQQKGKK
jgi:1-acyl-sn-glycerol-3-phosphate acyltransferase